MVPVPVTSASKYRADIDGLRAIAVLFVVGYHAFPAAFPGGFIGVDVFFVISGFLITGIIANDLKKESFSFLRFMLRRILRLFPALLVVLSVCLIAGWLLLYPVDFMQLGKQTIGGVAYIANIMQWRESGYFEGVAEAKPLLHLWSLGIEEQFYLIWPLILVLGFKMRIPLIWGVLFFLGISFASNIFFITNHSEAVFYLPVFRFWELLIGAALALSPPQLRDLGGQPTQRSIWSCHLFSTLGLGLICFSAWRLTKYASFPGWWALCPTLGTFFLIAAGPGGWVNRVVLSHPGTVWVGLISYPLYLWHWPLISFFYLCEIKLPYHFERYLVVAISIFLAWLSYRFVERPIRHRGNMLATAGVLLGISFVIGLAGFQIFMRKGVRGRLSDRYANASTLLAGLMDPALGEDVQDEWRHHKCFLGKGEADDVFAAECIEEKKPSIFLWGDSHAAALYVGLKDLQRSHDFGIIQRTASFCPPTLDWDNPQNRLCRGINNHSLELIYKLNPDVLLLEAQWVTGGYNLDISLALVQQLRENFHGKIVLLGSAPLWAQPVPKNIVQFYKQEEHFPPKYTDFGIMLANETKAMDARLIQAAERLDITFVSIFNAMCRKEENKCILLVGDQPADVTSFDQGHLSPAGAKFLMNRIAKEIFDGTPIREK